MKASSSIKLILFFLYKTLKIVGALSLVDRFEDLFRVYTPHLITRGGGGVGGFGEI